MQRTVPRQVCRTHYRIQTLHPADAFAWEVQYLEREMSGNAKQYKRVPSTLEGAGEHTKEGIASSPSACVFCITRLRTIANRNSNIGEYSNRGLVGAFGKTLSMPQLSRNDFNSSSKASGCSSGTKCPALGITMWRAMFSANASTKLRCATPKDAPPEIESTGIVSFPLAMRSRTLLPAPYTDR
jgi:hypothetical protein